MDTAVFAARKGELAGPVKTQYGYYVFTVTGVVAPTQQTLAEAKPAIQQTLASSASEGARPSWPTSRALAGRRSARTATRPPTARTGRNRLPHRRPVCNNIRMYAAT